MKSDIDQHIAMGMIGIGRMHTHIIQIYVTHMRSDDRVRNRDVPTDTVVGTRMR